jgi:DNA-binding MarR family transcriptional regulator
MMCNHSGVPATVLDPMLCFAVYSAERRIGQIYREELVPWGLSYTQFIVLIALWAEGPVTVGRIGELVGLDSGTLSPLLQRLERRGFVQRSRSSVDERVVTVASTASGDALRDELADVPRCVALRFGVTAEQAQALVGELAAIAR